MTFIKAWISRAFVILNNFLEDLLNTLVSDVQLCQKLSRQVSLEVGLLVAS